jgi:hypothetical protein
VALSSSVKVAGFTSALGVTCSLVLTVWPGYTAAKVFWPETLQPVGTATSKRTLRMVVGLSLRKVAVTSVAWPGAFHSEGVVSSGVPKVFATSGPPTDEVPMSWTTAVCEVEIGAVLIRTTPFS